MSYRVIVGGMRDYRPLLIEKIGLTLPGLKVLRLRLNEHRPEARPSAHHHPHGQLLVYLRGRGDQTVDGEHYSLRSGSVIYVRAGASHRFERERERRPLCLVLDVELAESRGVPETLGQLPAGDLTRIRSRISQLFAMRGIDGDDRQLSVGAAILDVLDPVLRSVGWLRSQPAPRAGAQSVTRRAERAIAATLSDSRIDLAELAAGLEMQRDHLNRTLKSECGLTLGQIRSRLRLREAQRLLRAGRPVGEVGGRVGMDDQNYFARWFRGQTGRSPSAWRVSG
jgi:AraC family transcriptional activator of pobA